MELEFINKISKAAFYISYYQAAKKLNNDAERLAFYDTIFNYIFEGVEPENLPFTVDLLFTTIKPFIDADIKRKRGGAPLGNNNAAKQPKNNLQNNLKTNKVEVEVNVDVNDKDKVEVEVSDPTDDPKKIKNDLRLEFVTEFQNKHGFNFGKKTINKLIELAPTLSFEDQLNYIKSKYPDKSGDELARLFVASLNWPEVKTKEEKKTKKPNLDIYKTAPKTCSRCGSKIVKWVGVPNAVICENCKTYWELEINEGGGNEWKCSRGA